MSSKSCVPANLFPADQRCPKMLYSSHSRNLSWKDSFPRASLKLEIDWSKLSSTIKFSQKLKISKVKIKLEMINLMLQSLEKGILAGRERKRVHYSWEQVNWDEFISFKCIYRYEISPIQA